MNSLFLYSPKLFEMSERERASQYTPTLLLTARIDIREDLGIPQMRASKAWAGHNMFFVLF
jgi:hypothetical protein